MARTPSYKGEISLGTAIVGGPVSPPKRAGADLTQFLATLRQLESIRASGSAANSLQFRIPEAGVSLTKTRFSQAATELGVGVRFVEGEKHPDGTVSLYVSTGVRRKHGTKDGATASAASEAPQKPATGLPKPPAKK